MALFITTATVHLGRDFTSNDMLDSSFHERLDRAVNTWVQKAESLVSGLVIVDISICGKFGVPLVVISYRSSAPTELSLQVLIAKAFKGEDKK